MRLIVGNVYQGRENYARKKYGNEADIARFSMEQLSDLLVENKSFYQIEEELKAREIIIADEPYEGLTPISIEERTLTENYGKLLQKLANDAASVEKIICGLPVILK